MKRRDFLKALGLSAVAMTIPGCSKSFQKNPSAKNRPNIIFLMSDDHGQKALSCYGSKINVTPNIDRLARQGMRFNNALCTNSLCAPSRAVILSGKYSHKNGVTGNEKQIADFQDSQKTLPILLQKGGYQTAMVGKWHLEFEPRGFDYWYILPGQGRYHNPEFIKMGQKITRQGYSTDIIMNESLNWLDNRDPDKPFFLMCHFKAPHVPHDYDDKHAHLYNDDLPEPPTFYDDYKTRCSAVQRPGKLYSIENMHPRDLRETPPKELQGLELRRWRYQKFFKGYLKVVASVDDNIGRLLDYLDKNNLTENTVVVYTTDNGFHLGDHGWYNKMWMTEESIHLPLLIRYPGEIAPKTVSEEMVLNLDYAPTFLDLADLSIPKDMQGKSFKPILQGRNKGSFRDSFYYHYYEQYGVPGLYGVRTQRYKLIYYYSIDEWELFDLQQDPEELLNVYNQPKYQQVVAQMKKELRRLRKLYDDRDFDFDQA